MNTDSTTMTKATIQMTPGDDMHLTLLMAPQALNFFTGQDREHLLAFGRAAFEAGRTTAEQGQHQVAEPAEDIWPCINLDVDEHGAVTNAKLYTPGLPAGNHDVYPVRVPYMDEHTEAWLTCVKELEKFDPTFLNREGMNGIECAASVIRELVGRAQDAARYRWLREQHDKGDDSVTIFIGDEQHGPGHLDAQVDEALAAQAKQGEQANG